MSTIDKFLLVLLKENIRNLPFLKFSKPKINKRGGVQITLGLITPRLFDTREYLLNMLA